MRKEYLTPPELAVDRAYEEKLDAQRRAGIGTDKTVADVIAAFDTFGGTAPETAAHLRLVAEPYASRIGLGPIGKYRFYASLLQVTLRWTAEHLAQAHYTVAIPH